MAWRVFAAFLIGVIVGSLAWTPMMGALSIGFVAGGLIYASPLALLAALIAGVAAAHIRKRPRIWSVLAGLLSLAA